MNNRQAGRRRGRGGQQQRQGGNPGQGNGNRIDNRARGNAAQLLEKYKNLARDAQMQGDRVNTEYYLQFADHYFRVLSESRSRFEEQNQQRRQRDDFDGDDEDFDVEADGNRAEEAEEQQEQRAQQPPRREREERQPRREREDRNGRANGYGNGHAVEGELFEAAAEERAPREEPAPRRGRRPRREEAQAVEESHAIDAAVLPPALGVIEPAPAEAAEEPVKKPRRRRTRAEDAEATA
ncbi:MULTISPECIES: DUF4167 domain-containing protein [unclassified Sphingomonas]|jgi:Domain of unknown function (DUF4167)|uniref:DUF4167 domain-containing protein n=1 Tax=unclassified Sphingomonas TaxID=196159 RepID=UPI000AF9F031|nr:MULTISPECIES: DUF4167 domain-containing protein [unclassified Sphingomonas]